jgi:opacity protein-like surface antigen
MKKIILSALAICAFTFASAQDMKFGVKGGLDLVSSSGASSTSMTGFYAGGFAEFGLSDALTLQPGVEYHTASKSEEVFPGYSVTYKSNFLAVPVLFKYKVAEKINLMAGPALYYNMDSEVTTDKTRFNLELGGSYDITENIFVDPRYSLGLNGETKISHILIGVGYKF